MHAFEAILALLLGATILSSFARRVGIPYPALLAVGGAVLAFVPGAPHLELPPELILALFVAPVLLDAAYDASLRDLRANWLPVGSLVLVAVGLTTAAVAVAARLVFPDMPWAAAIALGAVVAPPDAVAALAVLRHVQPPYRIRVILEGESLLNDASALLIYRLAVGAVAAGGFSLVDAAPTFGIVVFGSLIVGWLLAWPIGWVTSRIRNAPESVVFQFVITFAAWLLAERLGLSGVVTVVVLGLTLARKTASALSAQANLSTHLFWCDRLTRACLWCCAALWVCDSLCGVLRWRVSRMDILVDIVGRFNDERLEKGGGICCKGWSNARPSAFGACQTTGLKRLASGAG